MNNIVNDLSCEVVQDILPLYHDNICSDKSRNLVEEHIDSCDTCRNMLKLMDDEKVDESLSCEIHDILKRHARKEKTVAMKTGIVIAGFLMMPIIIAVILTLPGYSDWKTNVVLISSMLLVAGLTVVPLVSKKKKFSKTVIFSTLALLLIIFFVEMLFDDGGILSFCKIAFSTVLGISILLFPFVIRQVELPDIVKNHKGLLTMSWDTIWLYLVIFIFAIDYPGSAKDLLFVSTFCMALVWMIFIVARYLKVNRLAKTGIMAILFGGWASYGNYLGWVMITGTTVNGKPADTHMEILGVSILVGAICIVMGFVIGQIKKKGNIRMR